MKHFVAIHQIQYLQNGIRQMNNRKTCLDYLTNYHTIYTKPIRFC